MPFFDPLTRSGFYAPLSVTLSLCGSCNGQCLYCQIRNRPYIPMPPDKALGLLQELSRRGTQRIGFTQDEPLLYRELGSVLREARRSFRFVTLGSNGILVSERICELAAARLDSLILPLDGPQAIHDRHRGQGAFKAVEDASLAAQSKGIPLWFTCVLAADNLSYMEETLKLAEEMGGGLHIQPLYHAPEVAGDTAALTPDYSETVQLLETLLRLKRSGRALLNSPASLETMLKWSDFSRTRLDAAEAERLDLPRCRAATLFAHISSKGEIYPCTEELPGTGYNIFELGLPEALRRLRNSDKICKYTCRGSDYLEYNLLAAPKLSAWTNLLQIWRRSGKRP